MGMYEVSVYVNIPYNHFNEKEGRGLFHNEFKMCT